MHARILTDLFNSQKIPLCRRKPKNNEFMHVDINYYDIT
ncbi:hypothetical protein ACROYT_G044477 [Oculina patagonica]